MKRTQKTRVFVEGVDVSDRVLEATLRRAPDEVESATLVVVVGELDVDPDGTLNIYI